jgi:proteasome lid subunit RPN8/RPN11
MSSLGIRLTPTETLQPEAAPRPLGTALRWHSPFDAEERHPMVSVFFTHSAYIRVCVYTCVDTTNEVGGALIGQWCQDQESGQQFVVVQHALPARFTRQSNVYLTFTQDTLVDLHDQLEKRFPNEKIVGWYHTHPRMGIFLSHYDTFLHKNFFPEPWQVALVIEPYSSQGGFFIRQADGSFDPTRYFGFYEMDAASGHSIVRWQNLHQDAHAPEGDESNE